MPFLVYRLSRFLRLRLHGWYYEVETGFVYELGDDGDFRVHAA